MVLLIISLVVLRWRCQSTHSCDSYIILTGHNLFGRYRSRRCGQSIPCESARLRVHKRSRKEGFEVLRGGHRRDPHRLSFVAIPRVGSLEPDSCIRDVGPRRLCRVLRSIKSTSDAAIHTAYIGPVRP